MRIDRVDLSDERTFHGWYDVAREVWLEAWPGDPPWTGEEQKREFFAHREDVERILFVARTSTGEVAGAAQVNLPQKDNLHVADIAVSVRPACRGAGIGRALLEVAEQCATANGRSVHLSNTGGRATSLESRDARFAIAAGFHLGRTEIRRELRVPLGVGRLEELEQASAPLAADYDLVTWWNRCPDELVEGRARLAWTLSADEPRGELAVEPEHFDVERIRRWERDVEQAGRDLACAGAVSRATGELAASTEIGLPRKGEDVAIQFATVVAREHRGHRLGVLVKLANLRLIEGHPLAPRRVVTWNAESNAHMIRVNEELGFEVAGRGFNWQRTVGPP